MLYDSEYLKTSGNNQLLRPPVVDKAPLTLIELCDLKNENALLTPGIRWSPLIIGTCIIGDKLAIFGSFCR